ncbi:MAG: hypothetical protein U9R22_00360 [Pseudomonadota bacterium]|nr:hypothetical protein [Pseudomonadota bacterium]
MNRSQIISIHGASGSRGFTMIEAIVAFVVLAAGLLALLSFHSVTQKTNADAKIQAEAVAFAEEKLQELESFLAEDDARLAEGEGSDSPAGQLATFARAWEVSEDDDLANLTFAEVTVTWTDREGEEQQVVLNSAIDRKAPAQSVANFLDVVANAQGGGGGGGSTWGDPPDDEEPADPEDPVDPTEPDDPVDPPPTPVTASYTVTINGSVSGANLDDADGVLDTAGAPDIVSGGTPQCTIANGKKSFTCTVSYVAYSEGWSGYISLTVSKNVRYVVGGTCNKTPSIYFSNIKTTQSVTLSTC